MRVLIATPAYGGMINTKYLHGIRESIYGAVADRSFPEGLELGLYTIENESLINRGRNTCAAIAIEHGFDKLMFIDGDIGWKWPELLALIRSDKLVVGGAYPKKTLPITLNYNVLPEFAANVDRSRKNFDDHLELRKLADPVTGELEMMHIATGFMMIDVRVFRALVDKVPFYINRDGYGDLPTKVSDFFPVRVKDGMWESEDWAFCTICRENGIPIYLNMNIICDHTGSYTFDEPRKGVLRTL